MAGLEDCNETKTSMEPGLKLGKLKGGVKADPIEYRKYIGSYRYLAHTRPDLMYPAT